MRCSFTGKNTVLSDSTKQRVESKLGRLERLLPEGAEAFITMSVVKLDNKIEVTIPLQKRILRAEVVDKDMYAAIDAVVDILDQQMVKYKNRLRDKFRKDASFKEEFHAFTWTQNEEDEQTSKIERTKRFALKPMDAEEAVMEMELLGHNFYVFRNGNTDEVNVVYKRNNGTYGLIEPEY